MPDTKISAMVGATHFQAAEVLPGVQAGGNVKVAKSVLLTGGTGEDEVLKASGGQKVRMEDGPGTHKVEIDAVGGCAVITNSLSWQCPAGSNNGFYFDGAGNMTMGASLVGLGRAGLGIFTAETIYVDLTTGLPTIDMSGGGTFLLSGLTAGDWAVSPPATLLLALNRLSAKVKALNGGVPIP